MSSIKFEKNLKNVCFACHVVCAALAVSTNMLRLCNCLSFLDVSLIINNNIKIVYLRKEVLCPICDILQQYSSRFDKI